MSLYDDLGVPPDADAAAIKRAHRKGVKETHPDTGGSAEKFGAIQRAYHILSDDARRAHYDRTGDADAASMDPEAMLRRQAMEMVIQSIQVAISLAGDLIESVNIISSAMEFVNDKRDEVTRAIANNRREIEKIERVKSRLSRKNQDAADDPVMDMLNGGIANLNRGIEQNEALVERIDLAYATLKNYDYRCDPPAREARPDLDDILMRMPFAM